MSYPYTRYLAAKKSVDDRALHQGVVSELRALLPAGPVRVLEIGAGLGTMVARLLEWDLLRGGEYVLLDVDRQLLLDSRHWLCEWAQTRGLTPEVSEDWLGLGELRVQFVEAEIGDYLHRGLGEPADLLIANAFLDLVEVPATLPGLFRLLVPGGLYWFTINFDGETIFQPDHPDDSEFMAVYHRGMDERVRYGRPAGGRRAGRLRAQTTRPPGPAPPAPIDSKAARDGGHRDPNACHNRPGLAVHSRRTAHSSYTGSGTSSGRHPGPSAPDPPQRGHRYRRRSRDPSYPPAVV